MGEGPHLLRNAHQRYHRCGDSWARCQRCSDPPITRQKDKTAENFTVAEVSADKAYASNDNFTAIDAVGAKPYIMFKAGTTGGIGGLFQKMFHYFQFNRETFLAHYHRRSNIESTMMMVKTKFGDSVRSKTEIAAKNEVLAKFLCHNICCVIQSMHELGIEPVFGLDNSAQQNVNLHNEKA
jgi:hypothetical protein